MKSLFVQNGDCESSVPMENGLSSQSTYLTWQQDFKEQFKETRSVTRTAIDRRKAISRLYSAGHLVYAIDSDDGTVDYLQSKRSAGQDQGVGFRLCLPSKVSAVDSGFAFHFRCGYACTHNGAATPRWTQAIVVRTPQQSSNFQHMVEHGDELLQVNDFDVRMKWRYAFYL